MAKKKKVPLTKRQLDILYECWKEGTNTKERLSLIEERMPPKVSTLTSLKIMRRMAKTDTKWLKWTTRQNNLKEREKIEKLKEKERKIKEREQKKKYREQRREEKLQRQTQRNKKEQISKNIDPKLINELEDRISTEFFFCPETHQYVTNITCIFRVFNDFSFGTSCDKCKKMNKHIPILEEVVNGRSTKSVKRQRSKRDTTGKGRSKNASKKAGNGREERATRPEGG